MKTKKTKNNQKGMSLVEILLAVAIFVIGAVSVIHLHVSTQTSLAYTLDKSQAMLLAKEGIEERRKERNELGVSLLSEETNNILTLGEKEFIRNVDVVVVDEQATVTSTIQWQFLGETESVSFTEIITNWKYDWNQ